LREEVRFHESLGLVECVIFSIEHK
jgi:hypothetical protein